MSFSWKWSHGCSWSWMSRLSFKSRRIESMKTGLVVLHCVHPVQDDHVEVNVKVQRTAKALNEGHHAGSGPGRTGQSRALNQMGLNGSRDHRKATTERIGTAGEE